MPDFRYDMTGLPRNDFERIFEVIGEVAGNYTEDIGNFPTDGVEAFANAAREVLRITTDAQSMFMGLATIQLHAFLAGREHALRGYPSPVRRNVDTDADFEIPDDLRPPLPPTQD